jgi:uncharacterized protein with PhoU and TrkA domain
VRGDVTSKIKDLLHRGPKAVILEIVRALMRAVPLADPDIRDNDILDRLLEVAEAVTRASNAGRDAMKMIAEHVGDGRPIQDDIHDAARQVCG